MRPMILPSRIISFFFDDFSSMYSDCAWKL